MRRLYLFIDQLLADPARIYLYLALFWGLAFMVVSPPCSIPDEPAHFVRVFRVAQGDFFSSSQIKLPSLDAYCDLCDLVGVDRKPQYLDKQLMNFLHESAKPLVAEDAGSSYPPVSYIPAAVAVKLLSFFHPNTAVYLYGAKLATFGVSLLLTFAAIRMLPFGHWTMLVLGLLPMRLYLMASFSPDALTTAIAVFWIALVMSCMASEKSLSPSKLSLLAATGGALAFTKPMYALLLALVFVIPLNKLQVSKRWISVVWSAFVIFVLTLVLTVAIKNLIAVYNLQAALPSIQGGMQNSETLSTGSAGTFHFLSKVNPAYQLSLLLHEPSKIFPILVNGFVKAGWTIPKGCIGLFGWANVYMVNGLYWPAYLMVIFSAFLNERYEVSVRFRVISFVLFGFSILMISVGFYLLWTPVGHPYFQGVHGRYFAPYLPLLFLSYGGSSFLCEKNIKIAKIMTLFCTLTILVFSAIAIYTAYYRTPPVAGFLAITAKSDAPGVADLYIQSGKSLKWRKEGVVSLIPSTELLTYELRLPAKPINAMRVSVTSSQNMNLLLTDARVQTLNGKVVRLIDLAQNGEKGQVVSDCPEGEIIGKKRLFTTDSTHPIIEIMLGNTCFDLSSSGAECKKDSNE